MRWYNYERFQLFEYTSEPIIIRYTLGLLIQFQFDGRIQFWIGVQLASVLIAECNSSNEWIRNNYQHKDCRPLSYLLDYPKSSDLNFCTESYNQNAKKCLV